MENLYALKGVNSQNPSRLARYGMKLMAVVAMVLLLGNIANAQLTWTGATNNNFLLETNWIDGSNNPGSPVGKTVTIAKRTAYTNAPSLIGSSAVTVTNLEMAYDAADIPNLGELSINFDSDDVLFTVGGGGTIDYNTTGIVLNKGSVTMAGQRRLDFNGAYITVNGGKFTFEREIVFAGQNFPGTTGGVITVSNGTVEFKRALQGRRLAATTTQIFLTGANAKLVVTPYSTNYIPTQADVDAGWISGGADFNVVRSADITTGVVTFSTVPSTSVLIKNTARQVLTVGVSGTTIEMLPTTRVKNAKSLTWKYRKAGESTYTAFDPAITGSSMVPVFAQSGVYYVACEVVDADDVVVMSSNEVEIFVGSDKIAISPYNAIQYIRVNEALYDLTATFTGAASEIEWKYSTTPSGPYISFDPLATSATFSPKFASTGAHYVVCTAKIDGVDHVSTEVTFLVEAATSTAKWLDWKATYNTDLRYAANYTPAARHFKNSINIPAGVAVPKIDYAGNDTIYALTIAEGQKLVFEQPEGSVFNIRGEIYVNGLMEVKSGLVDHTGGYVRIPNNGDTLWVTGNATLKTVSFLMGNADAATAGGTLVVKNNASFYNVNGTPGRISKDTLESDTHIYDNAMVYMKGDVRTAVNDWVKKTAKIKTPAANCVPYWFYDSASGYTIIRARNTTAFAIDNDAVQYAGVDIAVGRALGVVNIDGVTTIDWHWSTSPLGPWTKFAGSDDQITYAPSFNQSGTYYIVARANGTTLSSNIARVEVVGLTVSPAEQEVLVSTDGSVMTYALSTGVTIVAGTESWFDVTLGVDNAVLLTSTATYTPNFSTVGVRDIVFYAQVKDEYSNSYDVFSNVAKVSVVSVLTGIKKPQIGSLVIYPNPSNGTFNVTCTKGGPVEVLDVKGTVVVSQQIGAGIQPVSVAQRGVYIVKVVDGDEVKIGRVIVK